MPPITIYTAPSCRGCKQTKNDFTRANIQYTERPVTEIPNDTLNALRAAGAPLQAPLVQVGDEYWTGYNPDKIQHTIDARTLAGAAA